MAFEYIELKKKEEEHQPFPTHIKVNDHTKQYLHTNRLTEKIVPRVEIVEEQPPKQTEEEKQQSTPKAKTNMAKERITLSYNNPFTGTQTYHSEFYLLVQHNSAHNVDLTYGSVFASGGRGVKHLLSKIIPKELVKTPVAEIERVEKEVEKTSDLKEIKTPLSETQKEILAAVIKAKRNQKQAIIVLENYGKKIDKDLQQIKTIENIENPNEQQKTFEKFLTEMHKKDPILYHSISLVLKVFGESKVMASEDIKKKDRDLFSLVNQTKVKQTESILNSIKKRVKGLIDIIKNSSIAELTKDLSTLEKFFGKQKKKEEEKV